MSNRNLITTAALDIEFDDVLLPKEFKLITKSPEGVLLVRSIIAAVRNGGRMLIQEGGARGVGYNRPRFIEFEVPKVISEGHNPPCYCTTCQNKQVQSIKQEVQQQQSGGFAIRPTNITQTDHLDSSTLLCKVCGRSLTWSGYDPKVEDFLAMHVECKQAELATEA